MKSQSRHFKAQRKVEVVLEGILVVTMVGGGAEVGRKREQLSLQTSGDSDKMEISSGRKMWPSFLRLWIKSKGQRNCCPCHPSVLST